jgi:protein-disulfide isomerase
MDHQESPIETRLEGETKEQKIRRDTRSWMQHPLLIPVAILGAGAMIAGAITLNVQPRTLSPSTDSNQLRNSLSEAAKDIRAVDESDHIFGNPAAEVTIVEFSDYECPFCASIHPALKQIVTEYDGKVRWVFRHFPLSQIHPEAHAASIASECVAQLGGNEAFWKFTDGIFAAQGEIGKTLYERLAQESGVALASFRLCSDQTQSEEASDRIESDLEDALNAGGNGTPYVVVMNAKGETFPFAGALPYAQIKQVIEQALASGQTTGEQL